MVCELCVCRLLEYAMPNCRGFNCCQLKPEASFFKPGMQFAAVHLYPKRHGYTGMHARARPSLTGLLCTQQGCTCFS